MLMTLISPKTKVSALFSEELLKITQQSRKCERNADNPTIRGSGSFKVTDFGTNQKLVVDFL